MAELTELQRQRLRSRMGTPASGGRSAAPVGVLPPLIKTLVGGLPPAQPSVKYSPSGPTVTPATSNAQVERDLGIEYAKGQIKALNPTVGEAIKRDFARIDAFEGILSELEDAAKTFRKGPIQGTYAKLGAKVTGGGAFPGVGNIAPVGSEESENILNYSDLRPGVAAGLYRAITGDDRISDKDAAARALPFVPDPYLQPKAFAKRLSIVKRAVQRKRASIRKSIRLGGSAPPADEDESLMRFHQGIQEALVGEDDE